MKLVLVIIFCAIASCSGSQKKPKVDSRVYNGYPVRQGKIPYIVGLLFLGNSNESSWCGGSIIANTWILTAAHCMMRAKSVRIFYGSTKLANSTNSHEVDSINFIPHPRFSEETFTNDIALIRTPYVPFSELINKVQLADRNESYDSWTSITCGWGETSDVHPQPHDLLCADFKIMSNDQCSRYSSTKIDDTMLCIDTIVGRSTCSGDSGGPLVTLNNPKLVGVTSFGATSCTKGKPEIFSRVSSNLDWIRNITGII